MSPAAPDPEPSPGPAAPGENAPASKPKWHIELGAGALTYSVLSGAGADGVMHPPRGGEADSTEPGPPPAALVAAAQEAHSAAPGAGPMPLAMLGAMLPGGVPASPDDMETLLEQVATAGARNYVLPGMDVAMHLDIHRLWAETDGATPDAVWRGEVTAKLGATWRVQHPDGKVDFIAWDEAEGTGTIGFRLVAASWPAASSAAIAAPYQGAGVIIMPYTAGGVYTGGDNQGKRLPACASAAVIAVKLAIINAQARLVPVTSADETGEGGLAGDMTELVE